MSVQDTIHDEVVAAVAALGLLHGGAPVPVEKRKLPAAREQLDVLPLIVVAPHPLTGRREPFETGGPAGPETVLVEHRYQAVIVAAANADPREGLPAYADWHGAIGDRFSPHDCLPAGPLAAEGASLLYTRVEPGVTLDREAYGMLYDYVAQDLTFACVQPAREVTR